MNAILGPTLELTVLLPGMLLAYLPVIPCLKQSPRRLAAWLAPLLLALCIAGGMLCRALECPTRPVLFALLLPAMMLYHKTLRISLWKSGQYLSGGLCGLCLRQQLLPRDQRRACCRSAFFPGCSLVPACRRDFI